MCGRVYSRDKTADEKTNSPEGFARFAPALNWHSPHQLIVVAIQQNVDALQLSVVALQLSVGVPQLRVGVPQLTKSLRCLH